MHIIVDEFVAINVRSAIDVNQVSWVQPPDQVAAPAVGVVQVAIGMVGGDPVHGGLGEILGFRVRLFQ